MSSLVLDKSDAGHSYRHGVERIAEPPIVPRLRNSYTVRIIPVFFDGGYEAYTTLVYEKPRQKIGHSSGKLEQRGPKLGWPGGRLDHNLDRTIFDAGVREFYQETGVRIHHSALVKALSANFRYPTPDRVQPYEPMAYHWDILFLAFFREALVPEPGHVPDPEEIEDVLLKVKLSDLPDLEYKGRRIAETHCRRTGKLFADPLIQDHLIERGVHHGDIDAAASLKKFKARSKK